MKTSSANPAAKMKLPFLDCLQKKKIDERKKQCGYFPAKEIVNNNSFKYNTPLFFLTRSVLRWGHQDI